MTNNNNYKKKKIEIKTGTFSAIVEKIYRTVMQLTTRFKLSKFVNGHFLATTTGRNVHFNCNPKVLWNVFFVQYSKICCFDYAHIFSE